MYAYTQMYKKHQTLLYCTNNANTYRTLLVYMDFCIIQGFKQVTMLFFSSP